MLIDTHCHLDLPPLSEQLELLLDEACAVGVMQWIVPSIGPENWQRIACLCANWPFLRPAYGIHPMCAAAVLPDQLQELERLAPAAVAIGEIGLDGLLGNLEQQEALFREQLRIARRYQLPVLVHCRKSIDRTIKILKEEGSDQYGGIMHAFSGSVESARECIRLGFAISLSATLLHPDAVRPARLARELPLSSLVLETDAPDLAPANRQPAFNRPAWLLDVALALAAIRGCTLDEITEATSATARRVIPGL